MSPLNASVRQAWSSDPSAKGGPGILVVDDDPETRQIICEALNHQGFTRVFQAGDGANGLSMYRQHADVIRALVLDVMMPNLSGAHVMESLMKIKPQALGVLLISGHADSLAAVSEKYRAANATLYVETMSKPFQLPELSARIKRILMMQGGPSALVGQGVLASPGPAPAGEPPAGARAAGSPAAAVRDAFSKRSLSSAPLPQTELARLEKQLETVETQLSAVVSAVSALRRLLDDFTRLRE